MLKKKNKDAREVNLEESNQRAQEPVTEKKEQRQEPSGLIMIDTTDRKLEHQEVLNHENPP